MTAGERPTTASTPDGAARRPSGRGEVRLEAPHRRGGSAPRLVERLAVVGFRATSWLLAVIPAGVARPVIGRLSQLSYLLWPTKRRWSDRNFGHVLGLDPRTGGCGGWRSVPTTGTAATWSS